MPSYAFWPLSVTIVAVPIFGLTLDTVGLFFLVFCLQSSIFLSLAIRNFVNLQAIFQLFNLTFLGLIPWLHYTEMAVMLRNTPLEPDLYIRTTLVLIVANLITYSAYLFATARGHHSANQEAPLLEGGAFTLIALSLSGLMLTLALNNFDFVSVLIRGQVAAAREDIITSSALMLVLDKVGRLLPAFCFFYAITELRGWRGVKILLGTILLLGAAPTGVARYMVAYIYIPLLLIAIPKLRSASLFIGLITASLLIIFPFLNQFRYFYGWGSIVFLPDPDFFYQIHFDAYENFGSAIETKFVSGGRQLLGVLLFFVPRSIWADKPIGSGHQLALDSGYFHSNISMPFLAEGYVNFGFFGVGIFSLFIGLIMAKLDTHFSNSRGMNRVRYKTVLFFYLNGALFFTLRGDLLSSGSYLLSGLIVYIVVGKFVGLANLFSNQVSSANHRAR